MTFEQLELFEGWRQVPGYEGFYEVSNWGRVRRVARGRGNTYLGKLLNPHLHTTGYHRVTLRGRKHRYIHRLVAAAFLGPCPLGKHIDHIDGDRKHNTVRNLRYLTPAENNSAAAKRNGRKECLTEVQVREIRRLYIEGMTQRSLAKEFGCSQASISMTVARKRWKNV